MGWLTRCGQERKSENWTFRRQCKTKCKLNQGMSNIIRDCGVSDAILFSDVGIPVEELMKRLRLSSLIFMTIMLIGIVGVFYALRVQATSKPREELDELLKTYTEVLSLAEENYADGVDTEKIIYDSIRGMLRTLDPHSNFLDPKTYSQLREDQQGNYYGLGITVAIRNARPTVISPIPGTPAYRLGIRSGDIIARIEGQSTDGFSVQDVVEKLRGPKGTNVNISLEREGIPELLDFSVARDEIPHYSVPFAFYLQSKVGYIRIDSFTETTEDEIVESLKKFGTGLDGLVLDLRNNPGGALDAAIGVADKFLKKDQDVLVTKGRVASANHIYPALKGTEGPPYAMVVLINGGSASASEIVAGAIQDHDRGLIVGETSFGKGLVQTAFSLSHGTGLALTTGKWYTPSGRLIQRDYSHKSFYDYYYNLGEKNPPTEIKHTDSGRVVYGGGGINPDVKIEISPPNQFQTLLLSRSVFFLFTRAYNANHSLANTPFEISESLLNEFRAFLHSHQVEYNETDFNDNLDFIKREITYEYDLAQLGPEEAQKVLLGGDPQVAKALEVLPQAKALLKDVGKAIASSGSSGK
jgi:carboxyl-terminal processing protease